MASPQPVILIPPSEGKADGGTGPGWTAGSMADRALDRHRREVLRAARAAGATRLRAPTLPAMERYTGVLYGELRWSTLPAAARRRGEDQLRVVSALWGLVAPHDPIPAYRLKMSVGLPGLGRLATWWRPRLGPVLARSTDDRVVWDLLPLEHRAAVDWDTCAPRQRVTIRFVDRDGRTVNHWNKLLKGSVVRWVLTEQPTCAAEIAGFEHPLGYRLDAEASEGIDTPVASLVLRQGP